MGVAEVILPTNDMGNPHLNIINHIHKVEDWAPIFPADHEIRLHSSIKGHLATDQVFHNTWSFGHFKLQCTAVLIRSTRGLKFLKISLVNLPTLALKVRPPIPPDTTIPIRTLIPVQP